MLAFLTLPTSLSAQMVYLPAKGQALQDDRTITFGWLSHVSGFTICLDGGGVSFVKAGQSQIDRIDTEAHELKHREQYSRYPNCAAFEAYNRVLKNHIVIEAEAYAAGLCAELGAGAKTPRESLERYFAEIISHYETNDQVMPFNILQFIRAFEKC